MTVGTVRLSYVKRAGDGRADLLISDDECSAGRCQGNTE